MKQPTSVETAGAKPNCAPVPGSEVPTPRTDKWEYEQECNFDVPWEENCRELERELVQCVNALKAVANRKTIGDEFDARKLRAPPGFRTTKPSDRRDKSMATKNTKSAKQNRPRRFNEARGSAALDKRIRKAVEADFQQWMIQSLTPDRGYMTPIDNVRALIRELVPPND